MVAERTGKLRIQITRHLLLRRGLSFGLAATHYPQIDASLFVYVCVCVFKRQKQGSLDNENMFDGDKICEHKTRKQIW